jgi:hypothetical protein
MARKHEEEPPPEERVIEGHVVEEGHMVARERRQVDPRRVLMLLIALLVIGWLGYSFLSKGPVVSCKNSGPALAVVNGKQVQVKNIYSCTGTSTVQITLENGNIVTGANTGG